MRAVADLGVTNVTSTVIATRGERLVLVRFLLSNRDKRTEAFPHRGARHHRDQRRQPDLRPASCSTPTTRSRLRRARCPIPRRRSGCPRADWSVITQAYAALNRREVPPTTPDWVNLDHRRGCPVRARRPDRKHPRLWDSTPDLSLYIEAVHRLTDLGAVITHVAIGTSNEGFDAEWRKIDLVTVEVN